MKELTKKQIKRELSEWYNPAAALRDCRGFLLDEIFTVLGIKDIATYEQYLEMTSKYDSPKKISKHMTIEQIVLRSRALVMIENIASSYEMGISEEQLEKSLRKHDSGLGMADILIPWARELYKYPRKSAPSISEEDLHFAREILESRS